MHGDDLRWVTVQTVALTSFIYELNRQKHAIILYDVPHFYGF